MKIDDIEIYTGEVDFNYRPIRRLEARIEATTLLHGAPTIEEANSKLRELAIKVGANAVVNATYESGVSLTSWKSMKVTGLAVEKESEFIECPSCAEKIKRNARKCRFCGHDLTDELGSPSAMSEEKVPEEHSSMPSEISAEIMEPLRADNPQVWIWVGIGAMMLIWLLISAQG